jgi:integrase
VQTKTVRGTKRDAQRELNRVLGEIATGDYVAPAKMTLAQFYTHWLKGIKDSVKPRTHQWYGDMLRIHVLPHLGELKLSEIMPLHIQEMYASLSESELSQSTVAGIHRALRAALNQAVKWGLLQRNPTDRVGAPRTDKRDMAILNPDQANALLEAAKHTGRRTLFLTALVTGMRKGELLALRWEDIDFDRCTISITGSLGQDRQRASTKTARGRRIPVPGQLIDELDRLPRLCEYVWCTPTGRPVSPRNLDRQFKNLLAKAELPDIRFHDLRHTHASLLLAAGVHPKVVQERLGHSSIAMTIDLYSHLMPGIQESATTAIADILGLAKMPENTSPLAGTLPEQ